MKLFIRINLYTLQAHVNNIWTLIYNVTSNKPWTVKFGHQIKADINLPKFGLDYI